MSIVNELQRIQQAKADLKAAIEAKGVTIEDTAKIDTYVPKVDEVYSAGYEKGKADGGGEVVVDNSILDSIITKTTEHLESETVTFVASTVFSDFTSLVSINLPLVEQVGEYAFRRCYSLATVSLPNVKNLGTECFYGDRSIVNIELPSVTSIAKGAFASATGLETLIIRTSQVCTLVNTSALSSTKIANGEGFVYVPNELVDSYKSATNWSTYADQIKGISELEEVSA